MTERIERTNHPLPTRQQLAAIHLAGRMKPGTQRIIQKVNEETEYALMMSRSAYARGDHRAAIHATRHGVLALCGKTPTDPMCVTPDGTRAVTCQGCLAAMDNDNATLARTAGYPDKGRKR